MKKSAFLFLDEYDIEGEGINSYATGRKFTLLYNFYIHQENKCERKGIKEISIIKKI